MDADRISLLSHDKICSIAESHHPKAKKVDCNIEHVSHYLLLPKKSEQTTIVEGMARLVTRTSANYANLAMQTTYTL